MKKRIIVMFCLILILLTGCGKGNISNVSVDYGTSSIYSRNDMDAAVSLIKDQFRLFDGCNLHSLTYTSDAISDDPDNIAWVNYPDSKESELVTHSYGPNVITR